MIHLKNKETGDDIGTLSEAQLQFLIEQFEEETTDDQSYWLNRDTLEMLSDNGASDELIEILETAFGDEDEIEIEWVRL